jgi:hypothetical protein
MPKPPTTKPSDIDHILRDKMPEIEALIEAMAANMADCDVMLAEMLEGETEVVRIAIVEKLREMIRARAEEKEQQLNKHLEAQKRVGIERERNMFMQWLSWIMSEETLRKIRMAFMIVPSLEKDVKSIGEDLARSVLLTELSNKNQLGGLTNNAPHVQKGQDRGADKGRKS